MMLRLVSTLSVHLSLTAAVLVGAGWGWTDDAASTPAGAAPTAQPAEAAAAPDAPASPETASPTPAESTFGGQRSAQALFESLPRFGEGVFALPAAEPEGAREAEEAPAVAGEREGPARVRAPSAGSPVANLPVPPNYIIGPGDTLSLSVWARDWEQVKTTVTVSPEGLIALPEAGQMTAAGQSLAQLREALLRIYGRTYDEPTVTVVVAEQRIVEVYVTGDAIRPGKYALPGMATVLSALYACGGPSPVGSYRRIQLSRAGQPPSTIDLYDYLLQGRRDNDVLLRPGDVLFIPTVGDEVAVAGEVRRPARYELQGTPTVGQALEMAGGRKPTAYAPVVYLWRAPEGRRWQMMSLDCSDPAARDLELPLRGGDLLIVKRMLPTGSNTVQLRGAVKRPGYYPIVPGAKLSDLLREAEGLSPNAHLGTGALLRRNADLHYEITTFSVRELLAGDPEADLVLKSYDIVEIFVQEDVEPEFKVELKGAVTRPGEYTWAANMRISQLLFEAGGPVPGAHLERAALLRIGPDKRYQTIALDLRAALDGQPEADLVLERGDILEVKLREEVEPVAQAHIEGYVREGGTYPRREGMKVSDLVFAAGGLLPGAGPIIELTHGHFEGQPQTTRLELTEAPDGYRVAPDLLLADDDSVCVTGRGEFSVQADLVHLQGRVQRPGSYAIKEQVGERGYTVWDLLRDGDGLLEDANPDGIVVYRRRDISIGEAQADDLRRVLSLLNLEARQPAMQLDADQQAQAITTSVRQGLQSVLSGPGGVSIILPPQPLSEEDRVAAIPVDGSKLIASRGHTSNLELQAGDTVVVPRLVNTVTVLGAVPRPGTVPYAAGQACSAYVNDSGGFREDAAAQRMVVVHANGKVTPIGGGDTLQPGDVIVVPARHIVRTVRTESSLQQWLRTVVPLVTAALIF